MPASRFELQHSGSPSEKAALEEKAEQLAGVLATGTWTHDYPITYEEASQLGLKVSSDMPPDVLQLMSLYPQPVRRQAAVEYLPTPRRADRTKPENTAE